jgi:ribosomal protein S18 acetylase RimI-like enzyme
LQPGYTQEGARVTIFSNIEKYNGLRKSFMQIEYSTGKIPVADQVIELYNKAGLPRPTTDKDRIQKMYENSNLIVTAWHDDKLVGVSRCITDWVWTCYLADLAVDPDYKKSGIGKKLIELTREKAGEQAKMLLLSVPTAFDYYPKVGFVKENRAFSIGRKK